MNNTHDKANRRQEHADDGITQNPRRRTLLPYLMVSATQTLVEFGSFTLLHLLTVPSTIANAVAIVLSASYNFLMNTRCCPRMVGAISSARIVRRWIIVGNIGVPALFECASPVVRACRARRMRHAVS